MVRRSEDSGTDREADDARCRECVNEARLQCAAGCYRVCLSSHWPPMPAFGWRILYAVGAPNGGRNLLRGRSKSSGKGLRTSNWKRRTTIPISEKAECRVARSLISGQPLKMV